MMTVTCQVTDRSGCDKRILYAIWIRFTQFNYRGSGRNSLTLNIHTHDFDSILKMKERKGRSRIELGAYVRRNK